MYTKLTNYLNNLIEAEIFPCISVCVSNGEEDIYKFSCGYSKSDSVQKVDDNSIFRIASMTKPITAVAVLICIEKGLIKLTDKVEKYIPVIGNLSVGEIVNNVLITRKTINQMTIQNVLTHTSGLGSGIVGNYLYSKMTPPRTLIEAMKIYEDWYLDFEPGTKQVYSGRNAFDLLARIVEIVSDRPYYDFIKQNIFDPLEMKDTTYLLTEEQQKRLVTLVYKNEKEEFTEDSDVRSGFGNFCVGFTSGCAGLFSTIKDYSNFAKMLSANGIFKGKRILKKESVDLMATPTLYKQMDEVDEFSSWGLGVQVRRKQNKHQPLPVGSFGWCGTYNTHFWVDRKNNMSAVIMANCNYGEVNTQIMKDIERLIMKSLFIKTR